MMLPRTSYQPSATQTIANPNNGQPAKSASELLQRREMEDLILSSFASLLSGAQTNGLDHTTTGKGNSPLSQFLSKNVEFNPTNPHATNCISLPSLTLHNNIRKCSTEMSLQDFASLNLAIPVCVSRKDVEFLPSRLLTNFSKSFKSLIDSRLRSSTTALMDQINKLGNTSVETSVLVQLLQQKPIVITAVVTSFRVLNDGNEVSAQPHPSGHGVIRMCPLVFEAVVDAKILGSIVTVPIQSPGTITTGFNSVDGLIDRIEVAFDTITLLQAMMKQARSIVKNAVKRAAVIAGSFRANASPTSHQPVSQMVQSRISSGLPLASCSSLNDVQAIQETGPKVNHTFPPNPFREEKRMNPFLPKISENVDNNTASVGGFLQFSNIMTNQTILEEQSRAARSLPPPKKEETPAPPPKKIELFAWLKGDGMLLDEDNDAPPSTNTTPPSENIEHPTTTAASNEDDGLAYLRNENWVPTAYGGVNGVLQAPEDLSLDKMSEKVLQPPSSPISPGTGAPRPMKKRRVSFQNMEHAL